MGIEGFSFPSAAHYKFIKVIGKGGMGIVYLASRICEGVRDDVVLKGLKRISPEEQSMLIKEANIATLLRHENIVKTYGIEAIKIKNLPIDIKEEMGLNKLSFTGEEKILFIVMDYIDGIDLGKLFREHLKRRLLIPVELIAFIISRMCRALEYAHNFIIHRDISPENILINNHGVAKLTDFGIAIPVGTKTQKIRGKLQYMSPEQIMGKDLDKRTDIFSLGMVAYHMLTGINPLLPKGTTVEERVEYTKRCLERPLPPPCEILPDIPKKLSDIIAKMVEISPEKRYTSFIEVGNELEMKYLYAKGFGPTNNSLRDYIKIFKSNFKQYTQNQLLQLKFLADSNNKVKLRRRLDPSSYTSIGKKMLQETPDIFLKGCLIG